MACKIILLQIVLANARAQPNPPPPPPQAETFKCRSSPSIGCGPCLFYKRTPVVPSPNVFDYECFECEDKVEPKGFSIRSDGRDFVDVGRTCPLPKNSVLPIVLGTVLPVLCYCIVLYLLYRCCYKKATDNRVQQGANSTGMAFVSQPIQTNGYPIRGRFSERISPNLAQQQEAFQDVNKMPLIGQPAPPLMSIDLVPATKKLVVKRTSGVPRPQPYKPNFVRPPSFSDIDAESQANLKPVSDSH